MHKKTKGANTEGKQTTITLMEEDLNTDEDILTYINDGKNMFHKAHRHTQGAPMQWHI